LISPGQVEEWIREVGERPESAVEIIRHISERLAALTENNERLLVENISLRNREKVEEYKSRIANLEYQLELLKRQLGGLPDIDASPDGLNLLIYDSNGRILNIPLDFDNVLQGEVFARLAVKSFVNGETPRLLVTDSNEELLCIFDSGRAVTLPVSKLGQTEMDALSWESAVLIEPQGGEELVTILPIAKMALANYCLQVSRRGYVKKVRESFLETYVANGNVGKGVVSPVDQTCEMILCDEADLLVMVSYEGSVGITPVSSLPSTIHEVFRQKPSDYVITAFIKGDRSAFMAVTQNGMIFNREAAWLAQGEDGKTKNRTILSKARLESGLRIVGADTVNNDDRAITLTSDGSLRLSNVAEMLRAGALFDRESTLNLLSITTFSN